MLGLLVEMTYPVHTIVRPGLGIKITLTLCHASGIHPRARQAVKILISDPDKISNQFFKSAGKILSSPGRLEGTKTLNSPSDFVEVYSPRCNQPVLLCRCPDRNSTNCVLHNWLTTRKMCLKKMIRSRKITRSEPQATNLVALILYKFLK
jgi:hypothetical protein